MSYTFEIFKDNAMLLLSNLSKVFLIIAGALTFAVSSYIVGACIHAMYTDTISEFGFSILIVSICMLVVSFHSITKVGKAERVYG